jgi:hypothetical protein
VSVAGDDEADEVVAIAVSQLDALGELSAEVSWHVPAALFTHSLTDDSSRLSRRRNF